MKTLQVQTRSGTKTYYLQPSSQGYDVFRVTPGFFSSGKKFIGHGGNIENAILVARVDAGDATVTSTRLRG